MAALITVYHPDTFEPKKTTIPNARDLAVHCGYTYSPGGRWIPPTESQPYAGMTKVDPKAVPIAQQILDRVGSSGRKAEVPGETYESQPTGPTISIEEVPDHVLAVQRMKDQRAAQEAEAEDGAGEEDGSGDEPDDAGEDEGETEVVKAPKPRAPRKPKA